MAQGLVRDIDNVLAISSALVGGFALFALRTDNEVVMQLLTDVLDLSMLLDVLPFPFTEYGRAEAWNNLPPDLKRVVEIFELDPLGDVKELIDKLLVCREYCWMLYDHPNPFLVETLRDVLNRLQGLYGEYLWPMLRNPTTKY